MSERVLLRSQNISSTSEITSSRILNYYTALLSSAAGLGWTRLDSECKVNILTQAMLNEVVEKLELYIHRFPIQFQTSANSRVRSCKMTRKSHRTYLNHWPRPIDASRANGLQVLGIILYIPIT
jgi:hypothetical protein